MHIGFLIRVFICIFVALILCYSSIYKQNELTELQLEIPKVAREIEALESKNARLKYLIESFENPIHLMELARKPEFRYLKHPYIKDIIFLPCPEIEGTMETSLQIDNNDKTIIK